MSIDVYPGPGERLRRLRRRRRLVREEMLALAVLLLVLAVTVAVLATQWLTSGPSAAGASAPASVLSPIHGGTT
jgi:hypothetical protein